MNLDQSNNSDLLDMVQDEDQLQPIRQEFWKKFEQILRLIALTLVIITALQKIFELLFPGKNYQIAWILTFAILSGTIAGSIVYFRNWIWQRVKMGLEFLKRIVPRLIVIGVIISGLIKLVRDIIKLFSRMSVRLRHALRILIVILVTIVIILVLLTKTQLGNLTRSWLTGPLIDLSSPQIEHTFQSTINLPWFNYGQDFGQVVGWQWKGVSQERSKIDLAFKELSQSGVKCILWFLFFDGRGSPKFDSTGTVTGLDLTFWSDYDAAIEIARKYELGIVWVLLDYKWMFPKKQDGTASLFGHADVIADSTKRASFFQNALIPILRRYPFEPHILGWILINEPENVLKDGFISFESIHEFTREATKLVKEFTYRQPVSIATADLESLLEYWSNDSIDFDFLVFHHYEQFLPPPASHIHALSEAKDKPIYMGEFDINAPPVSIHELIVWLQSLGFAGMWPWSLNEDTILPRYDDARLISNTIKATSKNSSRFREKFNKRYQWKTDSMTVDFRRKIQWWMQHGSSKVLQNVEQHVNKWQADSLYHETEYKVNVDWERNTLALLDTSSVRKSRKQEELKAAYDCLIRNRNWLDSTNVRVESLRNQIADFENELTHANRQLIDLQRANADTQETIQWINNVANYLNNTRPLLDQEERNMRDAQNGKRKCELWIQSINKQFEQIKSDSTSQAVFLAKARAKIELHSSLANWNRYHIKWGHVFYQQFWKAEIEWANSIGITP